MDQVAVRVPLSLRGVGHPPTADKIPVGLLLHVTCIFVLPAYIYTCNIYPFDRDVVLFAVDSAEGGFHFSCG